MLCSVSDDIFRKSENLRTFHDIITNSKKSHENVKKSDVFMRFSDFLMISSEHNQKKKSSIHMP